jgi:hypothetical protein
VAEVKRDDILFAAEVATRYHRRRATFLADTDRLLTFFQLLAGASAFGSLITAGGLLFAQVATALVTLAATVQAVFSLGVASCRHEVWLKRWLALLSDVMLDTDPSEATLGHWLKERLSIEAECVGELRTLELDCRNKAMRVLGWQGKEVPISWWRRRLIQVM